MKGSKLQVCVAYPPELLERLAALSKLTRVAKAVYFEEALHDLLAKPEYASKLRNAK